ncbi:polysaccharide biosynthesis C-terminal domain-containing protein [Ciceribacter thiooxidans]|uniref:Polysaccharide biosynthesis C-terminal domain-containing protein n=1 Tax=Ciceribacter thiooxidans TaxID=1969821 RepID=A0ABV7HY58_9HYPH|nr:polysaccharide biosynthesis C-terminal domain-containing protein [Ciceribacter thiooxidans]
MAKSIVANSALNAAAGLSLLLIGFACSIITARLLGPEANGIIAFSLWLAVTASLVAELGTGVMLLRLLPQLKSQGYSAADRRGFAAYLLRPVIGSTLLLIAVYAAVFTLAEYEHWATSTPVVVVITGALFVIQSIGSSAKNYLLGEQQVGTFFRLSAISGIFQLVGVAVGAVFFGIPGALIGYTLGFMVQFTYAAAILSVRANNCGISPRYLFGSSVLLSVQFIVDSIFLNRIEFFFLERYSGVATIGFYAAAMSLANLALQLPVQLTGSLVPYYSEKLQIHGGKTLPAAVFEAVVRNLSYITLPLSFGLAVIATRLVSTIFGEAFAPAGPALAILALVTPVNVLGLICTQYLFSLDRVRERLTISVIGAVTMIVGAFLVVPGYGAEGAATVRFAVFAVMSALMMRRLTFERSLAGLYWNLLRIALAAIACAGAAWLVLMYVPGLAGLVLAIAAGALCYIVALRVFCAVAAEDRAVAESIASRLPGAAGTVARRIVKLAFGRHGACRGES